MENLELQGKLLRKLPVQSGRSARGEWSKQEFLVEYQEGNFPATACFDVWGMDKVNDLARFADGEEIVVSFNINSREYNGKYYTNLRAWKIASAAQQPSAPAAVAAPAPAPYQQPSPAVNDVPAGFAPSYSPAEPADFVSDDLPF